MEDEEEKTLCVCDGGGGGCRVVFFNHDRTNRKLDASRRRRCELSSSLFLVDFTGACLEQRNDRPTQ